MTSTQKSAVNVIFGCMTFGRQGTQSARVFTLPECLAMLDIFQSHGHDQVDTARYYNEGSSEEYLASLNWKKRGLVMDTKFYPTAGRSGKPEPDGGWRLTPDHLRKSLELSLEALKTEKIDMWYLHGPDRGTPLEDTVRGINELYKEGLFTRWGVSNFMGWEVAKICEICKKEGYAMPSVYQGLYNAINRNVEPELFPCLRNYGIAFYAFNPLAGGYLTSRYTRDSTVEPNSRFDDEKFQGKAYRSRYWNEESFTALDILRPVCKKFGLTEVEVALRWMNHHSLLKRELGDGIIIGASSKEQMEENMRCLDDEKELPKEVLEALDEGWKVTKGVAAKYWH